MGSDSFLGPQGRPQRMEVDRLPGIVQSNSRHFPTRPMPSSRKISAAYRLARETYAELGVDTEAALARATAVPIPLHCWQADDVRGLEAQTQAVDSGGILATGGYPG